MTIFKNRKKIIFIYIVTNVVALFVSLFEVQGKLGNGFYLLKRDTSWIDKNNDKSGFWPLVKFIEHVDRSKEFGHSNYDFVRVNGVFYKYDISEFIFYVGILAAYLLYEKYVANKDKDQLKQSRL